MAGEYSREEITRMQSDAIRRVKDMQQRARHVVSEPEEFQTPEKEPNPPAPTGRLFSQPTKKSGFNLLNMINFKSLSLDSDTILIIVVLLVLAGDSSDELLMLALLYIIL